jgi:phosphoglycolate phosphatase-like HAD superfamily hydrolase
VLINTADLSYEIHKKVNPHFTFEQYKEISNGNFHEKWPEAKARLNLADISNDEFFEQYEEGIFRYTIEDILHDAILHLADKYTLVIVTSSSGRVVTSFINKENLAGCFAEIQGYEVHKSKVVKIKTLLDKYNLSPKDAVFVTDSLGDVEEGNACGVPVIAETWGMHDYELLQSGNPAVIIDDPRELVPTIEKMLC